MAKKYSKSKSRIKATGGNDFRASNVKVAFKNVMEKKKNEKA